MNFLTGDRRWQKSFNFLIRPVFNYPADFDLECPKATDRDASLPSLSVSIHWTRWSEGIGYTFCFRDTIYTFHYPWKETRSFRDNSLLSFWSFSSTVNTVPTIFLMASQLPLQFAQETLENTWSKWDIVSMISNSRHSSFKW